MDRSDGNEVLVWRGRHRGPISLPSFLPFCATDRQSPSSETLSMEIAVAVVEFRVWSLEEEKVSMQLLYE